MKSSIRLKHGKVAGRIVIDFVGDKPGDKQSKTPMLKKVEPAVVA